MFDNTDLFTAQGVYGIANQGPTFGVQAPTQRMASDSLDNGWRALISVDNPLLWFGALLLVTVGAAGVAGSVKLGPAKLSGSVGKS
jgi:hypothetical protein